MVTIVKFEQEIQKPAYKQVVFKKHFQESDIDETVIYDIDKLTVTQQMYSNKLNEMIDEYSFSKKNLHDMMKILNFTRERNETCMEENRYDVTEIF